MPSEHARLAVLLRSTQWAIDEAAFEIGAGRCTPAERHSLADALTELAKLLRVDSSEPLIIGATPEPPAIDTAVEEA